MSWFAGSITGTNENPLVTASRGELFVPIGVENHPPLARRIIIAFCAFALIVGGILFANRLYNKRITLPELNIAMIGKHIDEIADVPDTVTYAEVDFAYEVTDFEGLVTGCRYTARGNVEDLASVVACLLERYGDPGEFDKMALSVLSEEDVPTLGSATWTWDYGKYQVESLEALDSWGSNVAGYYINPTCLYMDLLVTSGTDGEVDIVIRYEARPRH